MNRLRLTSIALAVLALFTAGCGGKSTSPSSGTDAASKTETVDIEMMDIAYSPEELDLAKGQEVTFVFSNKDAIPHSAFIGDEEAQAAHETEMRARDGKMEEGHGGEEAAITVEPGKTGKLSYTFDKAGKFLIGCHQPGHYAAGMKVVITVA